MAITLQNLQNLSNVTSLSEVHLSSEGQVEAHGGLKSAFQKIGDFFKSLTASGRAEIASRNERLLFAMQEVVKASRNSQHEQERALTGSLNTVLNRLTEAAAHHRQKSVDDLLSSLRSERQFKALPEAARQQLEIAASSITRASTTARLAVNFLFVISLSSNPLSVCSTRRWNPSGVGAKGSLNFFTIGPPLRVLF